MIQHLFKANVLCIMLLTVFIMAVGNTNLAAQGTFSTAAGTSTSAEVKPETHNFSDDDLVDFKEEVIGLIEDAKQTPTLPEYEKSIREFYYKEFGNLVISQGFSIEYAANAAVTPTEKYSSKLTDGHKVDLQQLKEDTIDYFN